VILKLKAGAAPETVRAELLAAHPGLQILTNAHIRSEVLRVFRQTFAITGALKVIGLVVAVLGLALTLASVLLDRRPELTTLRALGMTRREMAGAAAVEGGVVAATGIGIGLAISLGLGWLVIYVINKQTFGWTLEYALPWGQMLVLALAVFGAAAAVSYIVGGWGARLPADREE
jgi:putative ABC transport system permease protein